MEQTHWWGHSKAHGWVVLDRTIAINAPGLKENLMFMRCRDSTTFVEKRKNWNPPSYSYAPNYLRGLAAEAGVDAKAELDAFQAQWPKFEEQIHREVREAEEQAQSLIDEAEKAQKEAAKEAAKERKKLAALEK